MESIADPSNQASSSSKRPRKSLFELDLLGINDSDLDIASDYSDSGSEYQLSMSDASDSDIDGDQSRPRDRPRSSARSSDSDRSSSSSPDVPSTSKGTPASKRKKAVSGKGKQKAKVPRKVVKPVHKRRARGKEEVEEVFAEDYDDPSKPDPAVEVPVPAPESVPPLPAPALQQTNPALVHDVVGDEPIFFETTACPNRVNPYHECLAYCRKRYGMREWDPDADMLKRRDRMLRKHPLPDGWVEVGDFDTGRYYYWNVQTDQVSWLSPSHPKSQITKSAESLGLVGKVGNLNSDGEEEEEAMEEKETSLHDEDSNSGSDTSLSDEEEYVDKRKGRRDFGRGGRGSKKDDLDPMDPAAYSDIARGGWSEGLDMRGKPKTGVDSTVSGPLFQQRPLPSPGDILRANQAIKKKKK